MAEGEQPAAPTPTAAVKEEPPTAPPTAPPNVPPTAPTTAAAAPAATAAAVNEEPPASQPVAPPAQGPAEAPTIPAAPTATAATTTAPLAPAVATATPATATAAVPPAPTTTAATLPTASATTTATAGGTETTTAVAVSTAAAVATPTAVATTTATAAGVATAAPAATATTVAIPTAVATTPATPATAAGIATAAPAATATTVAIPSAVATTPVTPATAAGVATAAPAATATTVAIPTAVATTPVTPATAAGVTTAAPAATTTTVAIPTAVATTPATAAGVVTAAPAATATTVAIPTAITTTPATAAGVATAAAVAAPTAVATTPAAITTTDSFAVAAAEAMAALPKTPVPTKVIPAILNPEPVRDPNIPSDRDAVANADRHKGTMLLNDLVKLHYFLWKKQQEQNPKPEEKKEEHSPPAPTEIKTEPQSDAPNDAVPASVPCGKEAAAAAAAVAAAAPAAAATDASPKPMDIDTPEETKITTTNAATTATTHSKLAPPTEGSDVEELATRLTELFKKGRRHELVGLKDVPTPFFMGGGRFFEQCASTENETDEKKKWKPLDDAAAKTYVSNLILKTFKELSESDNKEGEKMQVDDALEESEASAISTYVDDLFLNLKDIKTGEEARSDPRPYDVLFLPVESPWEESMNYEHQSGNKNLLYLASQHVSVETKESLSRVKAAFALVTAKVQVSSGTELVTQNQRFVIKRAEGDSVAAPAQQLKSWNNMQRDDLAEFASIFVFEVYLEKRFYEETMIGNNIVHNVGSPVTPCSTQAAMKDLLSPSDANKPSDVPIPNPTTHDVLFGRGGMTNGHPGNRRFRDIIALHRPDYVRATKMDKPNVARKIVRAIRQGNPPGRFLRKSLDDNWRDVGDKVAAEKTSQGLRERSNAEKRQRSAMRESLRIGRESLGGGSVGADGSPVNKKIKLEGGAIGVGGALNGNIVPLTLTTKKSGGSGKKTKKGINGLDEENATESLPPNAVDSDGNMMVTDHDILCGRGGLTNHHKGNKRFRDIVALHRPDYVRAPKIQKPSVARVIVRAIRNGDPPGRFLKKDSSTGHWFDIGDKKAAEKTSQALREKSDEEKEGNVVPPGFNSPTLIVPTATAAAAATNVDAALTDVAVAAAAATRMISSSVVAQPQPVVHNKAAAVPAAGGDAGVAAAVTNGGGIAVVKHEETKRVEEAKATDLSVKKEDVELAKEYHVEV